VLRQQVNVAELVADAATSILANEILKLQRRDPLKGLRGEKIGRFNAVDAGQTRGFARDRQNAQERCVTATGLGSRRWERPSDGRMGEASQDSVCPVKSDDSLISEQRPVNLQHIDLGMMVSF
jgi:hypothetical protein